MTQDLLTQLAEYGTYCEELQNEELDNDVIGAVVPLPMHSQPTRPRHRWLVAAAAAALILILVGGMAWLAKSDVQPAEQITVTTVLDSNQIDSIGWIPLDGSLPDLIISDGALFFGFSEGESPTEVFTSEDGLNWQRIATLEQSASFDSWQVWDGKAVLVGLTGEPSDWSFVVSVVEADGTVIEANVPLTIPEAHQPFLEGFEDVFARFIDDGAGLVIIGHYHLSHDRVFAAGLAGLGLTRSEVNDSGGTTIDDTTMSSGSVVIDLTLLGLDGDALNYPNRFQLTSEDGTNWVQIEAPASFEELVTIEGGLIGEEKVRHELLTSPDGVAWSELPAGVSGGDYELIPWNGEALLTSSSSNGLSAALATRNGVEPFDMSATEFATVNRNELEATDGRTLTAGRAGIAYLTGFTGGDGEHEAWSPRDIVISADGTTWTRAPLPDSVVGRQFSLAIGANGLIIVNEEGQAWFGTIVPS